MMQAKQIAGVSAALLALAGAAAAVAQTAEAKARVDQAKAAGIIGEQADGYLGLVAGAADPGVRQSMDEINSGRAAVYREAAARNGVSPEAAGAAAFDTVVKAKLRPGEYYRPAGSGWVRR